MPSYHIVAIAGSAGSSEVLKRIIHYTPFNKAAYVILRHLPKSYKCTLHINLKRHSKLQVMEAAQDMPLENNSVYYAPPEFHLTLKKGAFALVPRQAHAQNKAIDLFLLSLAKSRLVKRSITVILSGSGHDGIEGAEAVKRAGGLVIVQEPESCAFPFLPQQVIGKGLADFILQPEDMPPIMQGFANLPFRADG